MSILGGAIQGIQGAIAYEEAMDEIARLPEYRDYKPMSEMISLYSQLKGLSDNPFSSASNTAFDALVNQSTSNAMRSSAAIDPSVSGAVLSGMNNAGLQQGAMRQMSGDQLRANYMNQLGSVAQSFQELSNMNVGGFNQRLNQREVMLGNAASQARNNAESGWVETGDQLESYFAQYFGGMQANQTKREPAFKNEGLASGQQSGFYDPNRIQSSPVNAGEPEYVPQQQQTGSVQSSNIDFMGLFNSAGGGNGNLSGFSGGSGGGGFCWVARTVYGEKNPKWMQFREWLQNRAPESIYLAYAKNGEAFAESIKDSTIAKAIVRAVMDTILFFDSRRSEQIMTA